MYGKDSRLGSNQAKAIYTEARHRRCHAVPYRISIRRRYEFPRNKNFLCRRLIPSPPQVCHLLERLHYVTWVKRPLAFAATPLASYHISSKLLPNHKVKRLLIQLNTHARLIPKAFQDNHGSASINLSHGRVDRCTHASLHRMAHHEL